MTGLGVSHHRPERHRPVPYDYPQRCRQQCLAAFSPTLGQIGRRAAQPRAGGRIIIGKRAHEVTV